MVRAHEIEVVIPEDHRLTVEIPQSVRSGPARMILLVSTEDSAATVVPEAVPQETVAPEAVQQWRALAADLEADPRPFDDLSPEERRNRLNQVMGAGRDVASSSEDFAREKAAEIELEERKFGR